MSYRVKPKTSMITFLAFGAPIFLTFVSFASILDGLVTWASFFKEVIVTYHSIIREPLAAAIGAIWPETWTEIPKQIFDLVIFWSSCFAGNKLAIWIDSQKQQISLSSDMRPNHLNIKGLDWLWLWLLGPFGAFFIRKRMQRTRDKIVSMMQHKLKKEVIPEFLKSVKKMGYSEEEAKAISGNFSKQMESAHKGMRVPKVEILYKKIFRAYAYIIIAWVTMLFLNWQLIVECKKPREAVKRIGICHWSLAPSKG